ncbi:LysR substrate-binding domain-containing protein (plasmid) [Sinorhizobium medicae]|uniref:LysR substrate-binding domain-containing protein n=1 Tax=Sinorhizobium medicae TaxID=110321 RepID=UPI002AF6B7A4|nr:LysR substrate-binding domain-containing protein [Sinorhizobium medicae]WQO88655.1 LysR substrate-binding domain-containing protein [Sinorhizobium medicae]
MATVLTQWIEHIVGTWQEIQGAMARKRLHVSAYDAFSTLWLAPRLSLFRAENPELSIFVDTQDHDPDLRRNDFDLALRFGDGHWSDGEAIFLFRDEIVPVCSPGYLRELPPMTTPDSMKAHSIIDYSRGGRRGKAGRTGPSLPSAGRSKRAPTPITATTWMQSPPRWRDKVSC